MMTIFTRASDRQTVSLGNKIASSGEGEVWETNFSGILAKIYHSPTPERIEKLKAMLANPPVDPMKGKNHVSIAFPQDLLQDGSGNCVGFLMPAVLSSRELPSIYNPRLRKRNAPGFNWYYLHVTALNTAWIIQAIHEKGYVLGDIKPQNILVNDRALVAVIDTDSFQVRDDKSGKVYRCTVGSDGFTPVELLGKDFAVTDQSEVCDRFRLAVLIHYLLFGYHPFSGEWTGAGESPDQTELIRKGLWYGGNNSLIRPSRTTIPLDVVHPEIKRLFLKCFNDGHSSPKLRPTAEDWHNALQVAVNELTDCSKIDSHYYSRSFGKCYWCERSAKLSVDIFPGNFVTSSTAVTTTTPSTVIQPVPSSTTHSQTSTQPQSSWLAYIKMPPIRFLFALLSHNQIQNFQKWQNAVITGSVIGIFLLVGLLLTKQQPLSTQVSSQQVVEPHTSLTPSISNEGSSISPQSEQLQESITPTPEPTREAPTPEPTEQETPRPTSYSPQASISQAQAVELIYSWLRAKRVMFAPPYDREVASEITTGEQYRKAVGLNGSVDWLKDSNAYFQYGVQKIDSVDRFAADSDQATIQVKITEDRTFYKNGKIDPKETDFKTRAVRYNLQLIDGQWKIASSRILKEY